jgi:hypothetical protein
MLKYFFGGNMKPDDFVLLIDETFRNLHNLSKTKGREYSGVNDRFANFKEIAKDLIITPEQALWVYFYKRFCSIRTHIHDIAVNNPRVLSEPIEGRIDDAILYLLLLKGLLRDRDFERTPANES